MDNFVIIYRILKILEKSMDFEGLDIVSISAERLGVTQNRWQAIFKMLLDNGYVEGMQVYGSADGSISITCDTPRITLKGLEYLEENSMMKKAYRLAKGIKDITPGI